MSDEGDLPETMATYLRLRGLEPSPYRKKKRRRRVDDGDNAPPPIMHNAPLPVVSSQDANDDEDECPVCLEPLSFSFRLRGEKPHIVPECGHALHEVRIASQILF